MKTVLIVEDNDLNIDLLTQLLEGQFDLLVAKDGAQGVSMTIEHKPDLILLDISLPVMDGYQAAQSIRQTFESLPIIGVSASAMPADIDKAKAAGFNDYLTKPVDEDLLLNKLKEYLE